MHAPDVLRVSVEELSARVERVFLRAGLSQEHAGAVSRVIVAAERDGAKSHGLYRIDGCLATLQAGKASPTVVPVVSDDGSAVIRVQAGGAFSCAAFEAGVPVLAERARTFGLAALALRDAAHFSALWYEVEQLTSRGLAGLAMCPSYSAVAPAGGTRPLLGTNPLAFGWPRPDGPPYVFDFATSVVARGEIELHRRAGRPIPEGWALDAEGQPTTDATAALAGAMLPFGGHKGSALSTMVELLGGVLIGDRTSSEAVAALGTTVLTPTHGELVLAFDLDQFGGDGTAARAEHLFDLILDQGARLPSQRRFLARQRSDSEGIELTRAELDHLERLGGGAAQR